MKLSALLAPLIAAKAPHDLIMAQILAFEEQQAGAIEKRRESDRLRQARKRDIDVLSRDVTLRHSDSLLTGGDAGGLDNSLPQKIEPQESKKTTDALRDVEAFKAELSPFLNADQLAAMVKLRRQKRAVINGHAARLLLKAIERTGLSVSAAADKCVERNWISIEPAWLAPQNSRAPPRTHPLSDAFGAFDAQPRGQNEPIDISPNASSVRYLPARTG